MCFQCIDGIYWFVKMKFGMYWIYDFKICQLRSYLLIINLEIDLSYLCLLSVWRHLDKLQSIIQFEQIFQIFMKLPKVNSHTVDKLVKNSLIFSDLWKMHFYVPTLQNNMSCSLKKFLPAWLTVWYIPAIFGYIGFDNDFTHP